MSQNRNCGDFMTMRSNANVTGQRELRYADAFGIVRRHLRLAALLLSCPIVLSVLYYWVARPVFQSQAQLLMSRKHAPAEKIADEVLATHMRLIQSPVVVSRALERHRLTQLPSIVNRLKNHETVAENVIERLTITRGGLAQARLAQVLDVAYRGDSDIEAQRVLIAVVDGYYDFLKENPADTPVTGVLNVRHGHDELVQELTDARSRMQILLKTSSTAVPAPEFAGNDSMPNEPEHLQQESAAPGARAIATEARLKAIGAAVKDVDEATDRLLQGVHDARALANPGDFTNTILATPQLGRRFAPRLSICVAVGMICGTMLSFLGVFVADYRCVDRNGVSTQSEKFESQIESVVEADRRNSVTNATTGAPVNGAMPTSRLEILDHTGISEHGPADGAH